MPSPIFSGTLLSVLVVLRSVLAYVYSHRHLGHVQGPWLAKFSNLYRIALLASGRCAANYEALLSRYGQSYGFAQTM